LVVLGCVLVLHLHVAFDLDQAQANVQICLEVVCLVVSACWCWQVVEMWLKGTGSQQWLPQIAQVWVRRGMEQG
jgi:hypothetical protein